MAEDKKIHASEIEGLEEVLTEIVRKEFARRLPVEDMEELKRSPAGTVIRLEEQVQALTALTKAEFQNVDKRFENIDKRFENIDKQFEKIDERFENMVTKEEFNAEVERVDKRLDKVEANQVQTNKDIQNLQEMTKTLAVKMDEHTKTLGVKVDEQEKRLSLFQKVTYSFFSVLSAMMIAILILLIKLLTQS